MAVDEQFSLSWNTFNNNLSAGFHESLCQEELVDVTLAAEGQLVKAHRLVLSVCSPYFRNMFTQMPANQHAFVFLKDVNHTALKDLIQFIYCGEVNVKREALHAFISTAEALQIKGLTDQEDMPKYHTPTVPVISDPEICPIQELPLERRHSSSTWDSYNIKTNNTNTNESFEYLVPTPQKGDTLKSELFLKRQQCQPQQTNDKVAKKSGPFKRPTHQSIGGTFLNKRTRNTSGQKVTGSITELDIKYNSEVLDLPMKSESVFINDAAQENSYHEMRYEDSYPKANESELNNIGTNAESTLDNSVKNSISEIVKEENISNNSNVEVLNQESNIAVYSATSRGRVQLIYGGQPFIFEKNLKLPGGEEKKYWRCNQWWNQKCRSRVFTINDIVVPLNRYHTHEEIVKRKKRVRKVAQTTVTGKPSTTPSKKSSIAESAPTTIDVTEMSMHLKYEEIVADVTEMSVPKDPLSKEDKK